MSECAASEGVGYPFHEDCREKLSPDTVISLVYIDTLLPCWCAATMKGIVILKNLLSEEELNALGRDCSQASRHFVTHEQFAETSCGE